ncbi:MAG: hypothetical protein IJJ06_03710 [Mogibacterium sp.]|nr:hypothetical protein [Mogibacterium sp.]
MDGLTELLIYMATSAAGLTDEPANYGPLRMITAAQKLTEYMLKQDPDNAVLRAIADDIEENKGRYSTSPDAFAEMLNRVVEKTVDLL